MIIVTITIIFMLVNTCLHLPYLYFFAYFARASFITYLWTAEKART
jgi:hypothetical protein